MIPETPTVKMFAILKDPRNLRGDLDLPPHILKELKTDRSGGLWLLCPYSRTAIYVKKYGDIYYIIDDIWVSPYKNTILEDLAYEIAENCARVGRIHIKKAVDHMGSVKVEIEWGVPNLLWALYPRGVTDVLKAPWTIKALSFVTAPVFKLLNPLTKLWQKMVYKKVYKSALSMYPQFSGQMFRGMQYPEMML